MIFSNCVELYNHYHSWALDVLSPPKSPISFSFQFSRSVVSDSPWPHELQHARVGHDGATSLSLFTFMHWRRKWQPTPVLLPGESQGWGSLVAAVYGVTQSRTRLKWLSSSSSRPPSPSPTPGVHPNSCALSQWCHPAISSSVIPFSSCPQSLPASGSFPTSQLFAWGGQSIGVSASASVLPLNTQDWSPLGWTGWISLQSKGLTRVFSSTTVQKHQFFSTQLSSQYNSHIHTWPLEKP